MEDGMAAKILIVDDDASAREGLKRLLEDAGYRVSAAGTFHEGLHALTTDPPDLLIVDVRLGDFNGLQLLATSERPISAIVVTGYFDRALERDARQFGADYLVKPVSRDTLLATVGRKLGSPAGRSFAGPERRWLRKQVSKGIDTYVNESPARIVDLSYGGLRLEIDEPADDLPALLDVSLPQSPLSIHVAVVWKVRRDRQQWLCGAEISGADPLAASRWRGLVDAVA